MLHVSYSLVEGSGLAFGRSWDLGVAGIVLIACLAALGALVWGNSGWRRRRKRVLCPVHHRMAVVRVEFDASGAPCRAVHCSLVGDCPDCALACIERCS